MWVLAFSVSAALKFLTIWQPIAWLDDALEQFFAGWFPVTCSQLFDQLLLGLELLQDLKTVESLRLLLLHVLHVLLVRLPRAHRRRVGRPGANSRHLRRSKRVLRIGQVPSALRHLRAYAHAFDVRLRSFRGVESIVSTVLALDFLFQLQDLSEFEL